MWEDHLLHRCNNSTKIYYCPEKVPKIVHEPPTERHSGKKKKTQQWPSFKGATKCNEIYWFCFQRKRNVCIQRGQKISSPFLLPGFMKCWKPLDYWPMGKITRCTEIPIFIMQLLTFLYFIKKYERMRSYAGKNNLISAIIWILQSIS